MSAPETPRTWTLWRTTDMRWMSGDNDDIGGPVKVYEASTVDVEREEMLDLLAALEALLSSSVELAEGDDCNVDTARALLREHNRLSGEEGSSDG